MSAFVVHNPTKEMKRARLVGEENWFVSDRIVLFPLMDFLIQFHLSNLRFLPNSPTQPNPTPPILIFKQSHLTDTQENEGSRETRVNNGWPISGYHHAQKKKAPSLCRFDVLNVTQQQTKNWTEDSTSKKYRDKGVGHDGNSTRLLDDESFFGWKSTS